MSTASLQELMAASAMMITLEKIASSGRLPLAEEINVRELIVRAGKAFAMDSAAERPANGNVDLDMQLEGVAAALEGDATTHHSR